MTRNQQIRWLIKPAVFLASVAPSAWLAWAALHSRLSADPLANLTNECRTPIASSGGMWLERNRGEAEDLVQETLMEAPFVAYVMQDRDEPCANSWYLPNCSRPKVPRAVCRPDTLGRQLADAQPFDGAHLIALEEHVD